MTDAKLRKFGSTALILLVVAALVVVLAGALWLCSQRERGERVVTILAVNDIYRLDGVGEEKAGGLHRLRTLRKMVERETPHVLLLHAGDFLAPSLVSREFKGEQMISAMNHLDGDPVGFDKRMFVTFGNHEFDDSRCGADAAPLNARVAESQFTWLNANLKFAGCAGMTTIPALSNVKAGEIVAVNRLKIGIFGIGLTPEMSDGLSLTASKDTGRDYPGYHSTIEASRRMVAELRRKGADVIVALTHLDRALDEQIVRQLHGEGLDLLVGGHDHSQMVIADDRGTLRGFKADSEARTAWRIDIRKPASGRALIDPRLMTLNHTIAPDEAMNDLARSWNERAEKRICAKRAAAPDCLADEIGRTQTVIDLEDAANRGAETGFGSWLADQVKGIAKAQVAIVNSGSLGLDETIEAGSTLFMRHIVEMFRYDNPIAVGQFKARTVCDALRHGFARRHTGAWPYVSGVRAKMPGSKRALTKEDITIELTDTTVRCDSDDLVTVATVSYVLCGGDGYPFISESKLDRKTCEAEAASQVIDGKQGRTLRGLTEEAIRAARDGIKPEKTGRVQFQ